MTNETQKKDILTLDELENIMKGDFDVLKIKSVKNKGSPINPQKKSKKSQSVS
jgi:hypothetical protein